MGMISTEVDVFLKGMKPAFFQKFSFTVHAVGLIGVVGGRTAGGVTTTDQVTLKAALPHVSTSLQKIAAAIRKLEEGKTS